MFVLGAAAFVATGNVGNIEEDADQKASRVERTERIFNIKERVSTGVHGQAKGAQDFADKLDSQITTIRRDLASLVARLDEIGDKALPPNVIVPNIAPRGAEFALSGRADSYDDLVQYVANLRASGLFSQVNIEGVEGSGITGAGTAAEEGEDELVEFTIKALAVPTPGPEEGEGEAVPP